MTDSAHLLFSLKGFWTDSKMLKFNTHKIKVSKLKEKNCIYNKQNQHTDM